MKNCYSKQFLYLSLLTDFQQAPFLATTWFCEVNFNFFKWMSRTGIWQEITNLVLGQYNLLSSNKRKILLQPWFIWRGGLTVDSFNLKWFLFKLNNIYKLNKKKNLPTKTIFALINNVGWASIHAKILVYL